MKELMVYLQQRLQAAELDASKLKTTQLMQYIDLLYQWNKIYNLTATPSKEAFVDLHIVDSLLVGEFLMGDQIIDVGSGAGLPGIPLAIYYPDKQFILLDSRGKRTRFLRSVVETLKLKNVSIVNMRVEAYQPGAVFTTVITRAFATIAQMLEMTQHLCHPKGLFLAMKGRYPAAELALIPPGFVVSIQQHLVIPGINIDRHIIGVLYKDEFSHDKDCRNR